jgi:ubiquitin carboxyl-terminal hydrolase 4/11/15
VQKVEKALSRLLPVPITSVLLAEVYHSRIHRYLETALPLSDVRAEDQLFAFEVLQTPQELVQYQEKHAPSRRAQKAEDVKKQPQPRVLLIQAMHRRVVDVCRSDGRTWAQRREVFGLPFVMSAASSWTYATLHDMLMLHARRFLKNQRRDRQGSASSADNAQAQMPFVARIVNASGTACGACDRRNCTGCLLPKGNSRLRLRAGLLTGAVSTAKIYLALDWVDSGVYDQEYVDAVENDASVARANATEVDHDDAATDRSHHSEERAASKSSTAEKVPLSTCVDAFTQPEELKMEFGNGVKCEKCNKVVDAVKKLEIWREPDVLIIHIKRFHFTGVHYEKLNTPVDVPCRDLNLRPWIVGPMASTVAPYELYAVACHWGGMSGGHYTSYCSNQEGKEPVWLKYNDDVVNSVSLQQELDELSRQCYVLFYRKRAFSSSNLINYSSLV